MKNKIQIFDLRKGTFLVVYRTVSASEKKDKLRNFIVCICFMWPALNFPQTATNVWLYIKSKLQQRLVVHTWNVRGKERIRFLIETTEIVRIESI